MKILNSHSDTPEITEGLLKYLENIFPLSAAKSVKSEAELFKFQGAQSVIDHLRSVHEEQQRE